MSEVALLIETPATETETPITGAAESTEAAEAKRRTGHYVPMPDGLREKVEIDAQAAGLSVAEFVRQKLAALYGIAIAPAASRTHYSSEEERKAAHKAARVERQQLVSRLMAEHKAKMAASAAP